MKGVAAAKATRIKPIASARTMPTNANASKRTTATNTKATGSTTMRMAALATGLRTSTPFISMREGMFSHSSFAQTASLLLGSADGAFVKTASGQER